MLATSNAKVSARYVGEDLLVSVAAAKGLGMNQRA
jgi:hypothetical protein